MDFHGISWDLPSSKHGVLEGKGTTEIIDLPPQTLHPCFDETRGYPLASRTVLDQFPTKTTEVFRISHRVNHDNLVGGFNPSEKHESQLG